MAHWDGTHIVRAPPRPYPNYPNWEYINCGCCGGLQWGGESPRECDVCHGIGSYARHRSGTLAAYPGGPFLGSDRQ